MLCFCLHVYFILSNNNSYCHTVQILYHKKLFYFSFSFASLFFMCCRNCSPWMLQIVLDDNATLVQAIAWCHQEQAITWTNVERDLCHYIMPLCYNELISISFYMKDHHRVSSGWSSVWHCSNTGLSSTQYEQIPIILGVWPFWLTPFFFRSITFWRAYG